MANEYGYIGINKEWWIYDRTLHCTKIGQHTPFKTKQEAINEMQRLNHAKQVKE